MMGISMIDRIEQFHAKNLLHRDIKPENFVVGIGPENNVVNLIDFGLARLYRNMQGQHVAMKEGYGLIGTARYASINAHIGRELSRRDDLESIGYTLIYFLKGKLPWQDVKGSNRKAKYKRIKEMKINLPLEKLCEGLPTCFILFMNYVRNLHFNATPSYNLLRKLFEDTMKNFQMELDYEYDWVLKGNSDSVIVKETEKKRDEDIEQDENEAPGAHQKPADGNQDKQKNNPKQVQFACDDREALSPDNKR